MTINIYSGDTLINHMGVSERRKLKTGRPHQDLTKLRKAAWCTENGCGKRVIGRYNNNGSYHYICLICGHVYWKKPKM